MWLGAAANRQAALVHFDDVAEEVVPRVVQKAQVGAGDEAGFRRLQRLLAEVGFELLVEDEARVVLLPAILEAQRDDFLCGPRQSPRRAVVGRLERRQQRLVQPAQLLRHPIGQVVPQRPFRVGMRGEPQKVEIQPLVLGAHVLGLAARVERLVDPAVEHERARQERARRRLLDAGGDHVATGRHLCGGGGGLVSFKRQRRDESL